MAGEGTVWNQRVFNETLKRYLQVTTRTLQEVINTKAYYIARKAIWFTQKADSAKIVQSLGGWKTVDRLNKRGRIVKRKVMTLALSKRKRAPLAALIVNARRARGGDPGLYGTRMTAAIREVLAARHRSVAFIKSGWLVAVRRLASFADKKGEPQIDTAARQKGRPKGDARPAQATFNPIALIENRVTALRDKKNALLRWGQPGLNRAFQDETQSMIVYIENKMRKDAAEFNAKQRL